MNWCAGAPVLQEPTSFKLIWLGCYNFSISIRFRGCANTLWELPGNAVFYLMSTISTGPSCLSVGARVHCLLSCYVYISGSVLSLGETNCPTLRASQLLASLGGYQLNTIRVAQTVDCISPRLRSESSSVVMGKKESNDTLSYQEG